MNSPIKTYLLKLAKAQDPHKSLDEILDSLSTFEQCALAYDWRDWWARPEQLPPEHRWGSWGGLTARGWGKTRTMSEFVNQEVREGRVWAVGLIAQDEESCIKVMIEGPSGLVATSHPSCKAVYKKGEVMWENGATATVFTPQAPDSILGDEFDLMWMSEIHVWPKSTRIAAYDRIRMCVRVKAARTIWDSNPQRRHPLLRRLLERGEIDRERHVVFRGTTYDNLDNLNAEVVEEWTRDYGGTQLGREMLMGEQFDEIDGAIFRQEWLDNNRRRLPDQTKRRIIVVDPAISTRKSTDPTGIMDMAQGMDDQIYAVEDFTGRYSWEEWATLVVDRYSRVKCDCVIVERNRGGDACVANLRACCSARGIGVVVVDNKAQTHHSAGTLYVKEVIGRTSKVSRGEPVASLCEKGRISHVIGGNFADLEEQLTTYEDEPNAVSPNNYDAYVWGVWELAGFWHEQRDSRSEVASAAKALNMIAPPRAQSVGIYGSRSGGRRI